MSDVTIKYKGQSIATMDSTGSKTLNTQGKYCEGDIGVEYVKPAGPSGTKQISITANGTTTEDVTNYASAEITVDVSGGGGGSGYTLLASGSYTKTDAASQTLSIPVTYTGTAVYAYAVADEIIANTNQSYAFIALLDDGFPFTQYLSGGQSGITSAVNTSGSISTNAINASNSVWGGYFKLSRANNTYLIQPNTYNWFIYGEAAT